MCTIIAVKSIRFFVTAVIIFIHHQLKHFTRHFTMSTFKFISLEVFFFFQDRNGIAAKTETINQWRPEPDPLITFASNMNKFLGTLLLTTQKLERCGLPNLGPNLFYKTNVHLLRLGFQMSKRCLVGNRRLCWLISSHFFSFLFSSCLPNVSLREEVGPFSSLSKEMVGSRSGVSPERSAH